MADTDKTEDNNDNSADESERTPAMQLVLDNPFLLLFIGVVVPTVVYVIWGIMEILSVPVSQ